MLIVVRVEECDAVNATSPLEMRQLFASAPGEYAASVSVYIPSFLSLVQKVIATFLTPATFGVVPLSQRLLKTTIEHFQSSVVISSSTVPRLIYPRRLSFAYWFLVFAGP